MSLIQKHLIRWILQPLANVSNRIPDKVKNIIFVLCGSCIFFLNIFKNSGANSLRYLYIFILNCLVMGIMLLCTLPEKITPIKFDKKLMLPWLGFTAFMLIAGLTRSVDYLADTLLFLVMFPIFFLVWNNGRFPHVVKLLVCTVRIVAIAFFAVSAVFFPITGSKYASCFTNVNIFSISSLYLISSFSY